MARHGARIGRKAPLVLAVFLEALLVLGAQKIYAQEAGAEGYSPPDYSNHEYWLCRPDSPGDACDIELTATIVHPDGSTELEPFEPADNPAYDCFYVYPTTSMDRTGNSDLVPDASEFRTVSGQFARFKEVCRIYAPVYRQVTIPALTALMSGQGDMGADGVMAYRDVAAAFMHYLEHDNDGRPFVLVGHSQGTRMLITLIQQMIDGKPLQDRMLSALLLGFNVEVPLKGDVGGAFKSVPLCRSPSQTGCVVSYVSFRDAVPPPEGSRFGRVDTDGMKAACNNPADLSGDVSASLDGYFRVGGFFGNGTPADRWADDLVVDTTFVKVPGLFSGRCVNNEFGSYLSVHVNADPNDPRTDDIRGDVYTPDSEVLTQWGLHLIDVSLTQGDLIKLTRSQYAAFMRQARN
ncbi:MAG: DUF3089 domain-containing protein [Halieaceae bacterium]|jgi:hypothetical protein|nr:DUF3089 domain-containing protein [Halieaceae bacterium]